MKDYLDIRDLPQEDILLLEQMVEHMRAKALKKKEAMPSIEEFASWPLGAKGQLSRREIYEDF